MPTCRLLILPRNRYDPGTFLQTISTMAVKTRPTPKKKARASRPRGRKEGLLQQMGVLRVTLVALVILDVLASPSPGTSAVYSGWEMVPTLILPVLAPILLQVLLLDALMGRVMMSSATGMERSRYRRIVTVDLVFVIVLVFGWMPYFLKLFAR